MAVFIHYLEETPGESLDAETFLSRKIRDVEEHIRRSWKFLSTVRAIRDALAECPDEFESD